MKIGFDEKTHTYTVDGDIAFISVTELLHKHKLAPDYSKVDKADLKAKRDKGKEIHKDIENWFNMTDYEPTTVQGDRFSKWASKNIACGVAEQLLAYNYKGLVFAGCCDLVFFLKNGDIAIGDHKYTENIDKEYVSWQVSIYDYFARKLSGRTINGHKWNWKGANCFYCFKHTDEDLKVIELEKICDKEIERLFECEFNREVYQRPMLVVAEEFRLAIEKAEQVLLSVETELATAKLNAKKLRTQLLSEMQRQNVSEWETENFKVSLVRGYEKQTVDSKKLKREFPQAYINCQQISKVAPSVRVTAKGVEDEYI